jgi:predicted flap endonuclease-1-like 5' DNA nuclease
MATTTAAIQAEMARLRRELASLSETHDETLARYAETQARLDSVEQERSQFAASQRDEVERRDAELASLRSQLNAAQTEARVDDLERIEGVGPAFSRALQSAGIRNFSALRNADDATLRSAIERAGLKFAPSLPTWARQAALLDDGDEAGFTTFTESLRAGQLLDDEGRDDASGPEDDLQRIEGVGPKIERALKAQGIRTFSRLSRSSVRRLRQAIESEGITFAPSLETWSEQATFLARGDEAGFERLLTKLVAGRREV